jgi:integrase
MRQSGPDVWEYRYRDHSVAGSPMRQMTLSTADFATEAKAWKYLQKAGRLSEINGRTKPEQSVLFGQVIDRFIEKERLEEICAQLPGETTVKSMAYSTAVGYRSYLKNHIRPKWAEVPTEEIDAEKVVEWLEGLSLSGLTRGHLRGMMHLLFEKAMLWKMVATRRNPIELVKVKGLARRKKRPVILTVEQCQELISLLPEPFKTMATVAVCTGLRISEVLALHWEHLDLSKGTLRVTQGVVHGRIGPVKTAASEDELPLDPALIETLRKWQEQTSAEGLIFPSSKTGGCIHASNAHKHHIKPAGEKLGLKVGWHTFRHTYRSLLDETGAPVGVQQKLMRHSSVATTMNVYGRAGLKAKADANSKVVQMVLRPEVTPAIVGF